MNINCFIDQQAGTPIQIVTIDVYPNWLQQQHAINQQWLKTIGFVAKPNAVVLIPDNTGQLQQVLMTVADLNTVNTVAALSLTLPIGDYYFQHEENPYLFNWLLGWGMGGYQFTRYRKPERQAARVFLPEKHRTLINLFVSNNYLVRDLINTPTEDMGPQQLAEATEQLAHEFKAEFKQIVGDDLLKQGFNAIHAVGRASAQAPRLLDLRWGNNKHPKVTLIGKGVCFDTGGLDIKTSSGMAIMKKDMGGAAHVLGLARMMMMMGLPIQLRVLIPAVENSISANAFRPGDVIKMHKGLTVEITNTDAEGRLVLADAISAAIADHPELLIDMATLTGAAKVAVGPEIASLFSNNDEVAVGISHHATIMHDPVWRLPLHKPYRDMLKSNIADLTNSSESSYAGAITAALFLQEFVPNDTAWVHFDIMAWNTSVKPGRPVGAETSALRAVFHYLCERYSPLENSLS